MSKGSLASHLFYTAKKSCVHFLGEKIFLFDVAARISNFDLNPQHWEVLTGNFMPEYSPDKLVLREEEGRIRICAQMVFCTQNMLLFCQTSWQR